jgi:ribonuclease P protein component
LKSFEKGDLNEKDISAVEQKKEEQTRLQGKNENQEWQKHTFPQTSCRKEKTERQRRIKNFFNVKRFGLSGSERIKSKKDFENIFTFGKTALSSDLKIKAYYTMEPDSSGVRFAVAVSGKNGNAVWRNRIKRLLREAYRLNKSILSDFSMDRKVLLKIVFLPFRLNQKNNRTVRYDDIAPAVLEIMKKIVEVK